MPKRRGKRVFSLSFLDPSSPRLASGLPRPSNDFKLKEPAHLGEPITLGVSLSSLGRAAMVPSTLFSINRREGELRKGFQGLEGEGIERREKEEEEEERKGNNAEALPNRDCDQSLHRSLFGVLRAIVG